MDGFDRKTAARVWGRVQGRAVESGEDLPGVLLQVHLENKLLQFLVRSNSGRKAELLHGLIRSGLEQEQILQGIHRLRYGKVETGDAGKPCGGGAATVLPGTFAAEQTV